MFALRVSRRVGVSALRSLTTTPARPMSEMAFTFAAPNGVLYDGANVKQVDVPSFSGSFGILPAHVPSLAVLKPGVVTVYEQEGAPKKFFVSSGSVTINEDNSVQILAEEAHPLDCLDASEAQQALSQAQSQMNSAADEVAKAEAQIAVEVAEELIKAVQ
ncbi:hypothetical protein TCAL_02043 [Tigriopus californicus]|uniref:ATP synthase F(1) complex subunit delta, mitochondrial n=1 Tax=Tigriopus californicus TaxID=6832 RepID=A0A553NDZ0_TIGCA|nr:ATP synthase subunit delta, mitochondrial-like [Tigriopus californicus]TRY63660.1 hypothetical protein TCAL_02043 [Tigriopus californicus]|eukprot:TCALIF_02043-PA protein Name:"Similar to Atp5d ATP synthase subunit delta, mitochondrial (Mus musculus)" AED:0.04 eAED:0.04 QI:0/-1/0/1/-1/1/1/0/159